MWPSMRAFLRLTLLLPTALPAATQTPDEAGAWIARLHDDRQRMTALSRLPTLGAKVLPLLVADYSQHKAQKDTKGACHTLLAITRFGPAAAPIGKELCAALADADLDLQVPLLRAIGAVGPAILDIEPDAMNLVRDTNTPVGRSRQEWNLTLARLALNGAETEELRGQLQNKTLVAVCAAAMWLVEDPRRAGGMQELLRDANRTANLFRTQQGESWQLMVEETALAVARCDDDAGWRENAWGQLLGYFDPAIRAEAATTLRRVPGAATAAVPALIAALDDPERAVVREVMLTLAFFSDEAIGALPPLLALQANGDAELRLIAKAASRDIRHNLTSIPAAVAELLDGDEVAAAAAVQRVAAIGPRAKVPLEAMQVRAKGAIEQRIEAALAELNRGTSTTRARR